jgi:hypothetical protein
MEKQAEPPWPLSKVYYRPLEAAIRWSGLVREEPFILDALKGNWLPPFSDIDPWPALRLNTERLYDGVINRELPIVINGVRAEGAVVNLNHPDLTLRHIDLKAWMTRWYPDQRPRFLFSRLERRPQRAGSFGDVNALVMERDALRLHVADRDRLIQQLRRPRGTNGTEERAPDIETHNGGVPSSRSETTHLNVIGGLLHLLMGSSPSGQAYSSFRTQESIIDALVAHYGDKLGMSKRTLEAKFAAAKRKLSAP